MISRFFCCISTKTGCLIIGGLYAFVGLSLLYFTILLLPYERIAKLTPDELTFYILYLLLVSLYYIWVSFGGFLMIYGVIMRQNKKMVPLLLTLFSYTFMVVVCALFYNFLPIESDEFGDYYGRTPLIDFFVEYSPIWYISGMVLGCHFALCIIVEMEKIQNEHIEENARLCNDKEALLTTKPYLLYV